MKILRVAMTAGMRDELVKVSGGGINGIWIDGEEPPADASSLFTADTLPANVVLGTLTFNADDADGHEDARWRKLPAETRAVVITAMEKAIEFSDRMGAEARVSGKDGSVRRADGLARAYRAAVAVLLAAGSDA